MRILYYLEPWVELDRLDFRFPTLRAHLVPEIRALLEARPDHEIVVVVGDGVRREIQRTQLDTSGWRYVSVPELELRRVFPDYREAAAAWYHETFDAGQLRAHQRLLARHLNGFEPDVVIAYETSVPFMRAMFPNAAIVHSMFGAFSRPPFSGLSLLDPRGLYGRSSLVAHADAIRSFPIDNEQRAMLSRLRRIVAKPLVDLDPTAAIVARYRKRFDKLVLLPLQVDGYYAFSETCRWKGQVEFTLAVLEALPSDCGLIVTEHGEYDSHFTDEFLTTVRDRDSRFIFDRTLNAIPFVSQFLTLHVDAVVAVSSSIAFQAAFWGKPVVAAGRSHINVIATVEGIERISEAMDFASAPTVDVDPALYWILTHGNCFTRHEHFDGTWYSEFLDRAVNAHRSGTLHRFDFFRQLRDDDETEAAFQRNSRSSHLRAALDRAGVAPAASELLRKITDAEVVSFDLFDTLVARPFAEPHELFLHVQPRVQELLRNDNFPFHRLRREAEANVRRPTRGHVEVTLDDIYHEFGQLTGLDEEMLARIQQIELAAELEFVSPRREVLRAFRFALALGLPVYVITDTYLSRWFIEELLRKNGVTGYTGLFVSSEESVRKHDGKIFPRYLGTVRRRHRVGPNHCVHIGDNVRADGEMARAHGIKTHIVPRSVELFQKTKLGDVFAGALRAKHLSTSILVGSLANRLFDNPETPHDRATLFDGDPFVLGYAALGPLVVGFTQWLVQRLRANRIERVYFLARDGWILRLVYEELRAASPDLGVAVMLITRRPSPADAAAAPC